MSAITVGGDLVHYEVLGRGRPVILVHGWLGSWRYWIPTMQHLHMKYRVYALDLFGHGDSSKTPSRYNLDYQVDMLDEFMDQLAIPKAAFVAHGLGAMVVSEFAFKHQAKRVPRMMLVSTPLFDIGDLENRKPERISKSAQKAAFNIDDPDQTIPAGSLESTIPSAGMMRAALLERVNARNHDIGGRGTGTLSSGYNMASPSKNYLAESIGTTSLVEMLGKCFKKNAESEYDKLLSDVENTDNRILERSIEEFKDAAKILDTVQQLKIPTVLVHGAEDKVVTPPNEAVWDYVTREHDDMIAIPLPNVRHFPMLEYDRFGRLINDFLEAPDVSKLEVKDRWRRRSR